MSHRRVAIITGSATGVGAATALGLAQRGYNVVINYSRSESEAHASAALCRAAGAEVLVQRGDVANDDDCKALVVSGAGILCSELHHKPFMRIGTAIQ